jgi:hypothetical protein
MRWFVHNFAAPALAVAVLIGMLATTAMRKTPADVGAYHDRVAEAINNVPYVIGDWIGEKTEIPTQATDMLRPNAYVSRRYTNSRTGQTMQLLLVHCKDARNLKGHYPPECYPSQGWVMTQRQSQTMPLPKGDAEEQIRVMRYGFTRDKFTGKSQLEVLNLMVLPNGRFDVGMGGVSDVSGDYTLRHLGAGELQLLPDPSMSRQQREQAFKVFFEAIEPALNTIRAGRQQTADQQPAQN